MPEQAASSPFEFRGGQVVLTAQLRDTDQRFLIDTGVNPSVIDLRVAEAMAFEIDRSVVGEAEGAGDGEGLEIMPSSISFLEIDGVSIEPIDAVTADMQPFANALRLDELAGILGYSFLKDRVVRIDYQNSTIELAESSEDLPDIAGEVLVEHVVPLRFLGPDDPIPLITVYINDQPVTLSFDTGSSGAIELFGNATSRLGLQALRENGTSSRSVGARGERVLSKSTLDAVGFGSTTITDVAVRFSDRAGESEARDGNAGNKLFENYAVTLDYIEREITFTRVR